MKFSKYTPESFLHELAFSIPPPPQKLNFSATCVHTQMERERPIGTLPTARGCIQTEPNPRVLGLKLGLRGCIWAQALLVSHRAQLDQAWTPSLVNKLAPTLSLLDSPTHYVYIYLWFLSFTLTKPTPHSGFRLQRNPYVNGLIFASMTTYKETSSNKPTKYRENDLLDLF